VCAQLVPEWGPEIADANSVSQAYRGPINWLEICIQSARSPNLRVSMGILFGIAVSRGPQKLIQIHTTIETVNASSEDGRLYSELHICMHISIHIFDVCIYGCIYTNVEVYIDAYIYIDT
jgi:hypothetical protein